MLSPNDFKGLIGIDERIKQVKSLLCLHKTDVRIIGIWGMGGIGKTTLAEAIFKQISGHQFKGVCLIHNIREKLENSGGLDCLQKNILSDLELDSPRIIPLAIKKRLNRTKVFIVLDDVDDFIPLETLARRVDGLGQGSRIIITSRDKHVLRNCKVNDQNIYGVEEFNHYEALQLFCNYAFNQNHPTRDLMILSDDIVNYAKGNPLALKVLGSSLNQKSKKVWESAVNKLRTNVDRKIFDVLKISYDGLNDGEQEAFLDIACFLKGENRDYVASILDDCESWLSVLIDKSLITVSHFNTIEMHDLLQDLGREIVRKESPKNPGQRSRLWTQEDVQHTLKHDVGTNAVQGISLNMFNIKDMHLSLEAFNKMHNLRLLKFYYSNRLNKMFNLALLDFYDSNERDTRSFNKVQFREGLNNAPFDKLRSFIWFGYPLPALSSNFNLENLVELDLSFSSNFERLWEDTEHAPKLKWLDLHGCPRLIEVPNLSKSPFLKKIDLSGCLHLTKIQNLSNLALLEVIGLNGCSNIIEIPDLSGSPLLETIGVQNCRSLLEFPLLAPCVNRLCDLNISGCESLRSIPSTIVSHFKYLTSLSLSSCINLTTFPHISGNIVWLDLSGTAIDEVPPSIENLINLYYLGLPKSIRLISTNICKLKYLEKLDLENCSQLESFPEILDKMEGLEILILSGTAIKELPHSIENLIKLSLLNLSKCTRLKQISTNICKLKYLEKLDLENCSQLESFPEILDRMEGLEILILSGTAIKELPHSIEHLMKLSDLDLRRCKNLESLPCSLCNLISLKYLDISDCSKLEILPENFGNLKSLEDLSMDRIAISQLPSTMRHLNETVKISCCGCKDLRFTDLLDLPCSLTWIYLNDCNLNKIPEDIDCLSSLEFLELSGNNFESLPKSMKQLYKLTYLMMDKCNTLQSLTELPSALKHLSAIGCKQLRSIPDASEFANFVKAEFIFTNCMNLKETTVSNMLATLKEAYEGEIGELTFCCPGSKVPGWFMYRTEGSIVDCCEIFNIKFQIPWHDCFDGRRLLGFVICAVLASEEYLDHQLWVGYKYTCSDGNESSPNDITVASRNGRGYIRVYSRNGSLIDSDHMAFRFCKASVPRVRKSDITNCSFEFWLSNEKSPNCIMKSCGVCPIYAKHNITLPSLKKQKA